MPQAVAAYVATALYAASAYAISYGLIYAVTYAVASYAISAGIGKLTQALTKKPGAGIAPINISVRSTVSPRRIAFGTVRSGGAIVFVRTSGSKSKYLWYVVVYEGHQCHALKDAWLDKFKIPAADINGTTGAVSTAVMNGKLKIWDHLGTGAQTADSNLTAEFASTWLSTHRLRGCCYRVIRFERDSKAWPTGAPQSVSSLLEGAYLYDPRLDTTNGGAGSNRASDPSTWAFSNNWALVVRWYLSGGSVVNDQSSRLIRYGVQESDSRIDDSYIIAAANICDQSLSGANAPPSGAQVRYTCDIETTCDRTRRDVLEELLVCGGPGQLINLHGKWRLYAAAYDAPVHTFSHLDLVGEIDIEDTFGDEERFNQISAIYMDADKEWTEQTSPVRSNATYVTQDGAKEIPRSIILRGISNQYRAQRVSELNLRAARQMRVVKLPLGRQGMKIAPWETFSFTHPRYGWSSRIFRCIERDIQRNDSGGMIAFITAKAESTNVYTDLLTADYTSGTSVTNAIQTEAPDEPTSLTATSLIGAIEFHWTLGDFWLRNGMVELWEYTANTPFSSATKIWEGRGTWASIPKSDTVTRYYWVRVAAIGGEFSSTEPSGNGLPGVAQAVTDIVQDPEFSLATDVSYWLPYTASGGATALSASGGANAGKATLTSGGAGSAAYIFSRRRPAHMLLPGTFYTVAIRWRRTGTLGGVGAASLAVGAVRHGQDPASASTFNAAAADVFFGYGQILIAKAEINARTVNVWQEESATIWFPKDPAFSPGASVYVSAFAGFTEAQSTELIEVDSLNLTQGLASDPFTLRYTDSLGAVTPLADTVFFKKFLLDSASNYQFNLPEAQTSYIGAKIWFEVRGTGTLTVSVSSGSDVLRSAPSTTGNRNLNGRGAVALAECISATEWQLSGDLA